MKQILRGKDRKITVPEEKWKKVKDAVDEIMTATQSVRDQMTTNLEHFRGELWDEDKLEKIGGRKESSAVINLFFMVVESIAPMLSDNKPIATLIPRLPFLEEAAVSYNNFIKYEWDACDMQMTLYKAALDALIMKLAVFEFAYDENANYGGQIKIRLVDPRNYFCAPGYDDNWEAPLQGVVEELPLSWIRSNFPGVKKITPTSHVTSKSAKGGDTRSKIRAFKYGDAESFELENYFAKVYRVWMRDNISVMDFIDTDTETGEKKTVTKKAYPYGKMMYFTEHEYLGTKACAEVHGKPPFVTMVNYIDPHNLLGIDENQQIRGLNQELQIQFQAFTGHSRRHHNPNKIVDLGLQVDPNDVEARFDLGGQTFSKDSTYENSGPGIEYIEHPLLDPSVPQLLNMIPDMVDKISGSTETSRGEVGKKERQSASELAILMESSHTRTRQRVRNEEWSIKRVIYLMCRMAQQYYTEERPIYTQELGSEGRVYDTFASTKVRLHSLLSESLAEMGIQDPKPKGNETEGLTQDQRRAIDDYEQFCKNFNKNKDLDPILFDFDIEIQTNSTLPMDKQSQANLALRLFQLKVIDRQAVLETLGFPNWRAILARIDEEKAEAASMKPPGGGGGGGPKLPQGIPQPGKQMSLVGG